MLNKVTLIGRIGKIDTKISTATKYSLATTESHKNQQTGNWDEKTEWHNLVSFGKCSEHIRSKLQPGDLIYIEGKLQTSKWQDQQGNDRYTTEIVVLDFPKKLPKYYNQNGSNAAPQQGHQYEPQPMSQAAGQQHAPPHNPDWAGDINF